MEERRAEFERTWRGPPGLVGRLGVTNNQPLGMRFMLTAFAFFLIGGVLALLMRIQLAVPQNDFLGPQLYNQLFTMHGSTMMFLFIVPFLEGLAVYLLPLMIGSRDLAFPRLTAFGYWTFLFGGAVFYLSFLFGAIPDAGWFAYTPLSGPRYSGLGVDFWLLGLALVEIAGITAGVEIIVTFLKLRAPGMSIDRVPVFAWAIFTVSVMIVFAFTTLLTATLLLELDRAAGTRFFDPDSGGTSLLWQHLFWFFGHPEVYIAFLPATGIVSMVIPVFSRRPLVAYTLVVVAIIVTAFISFGLWVHHMYTTGLPTLSMNFFAAASLMIAIASGIQVFAWIATMWGRRPALRPPMLFVLGFFFIFVLGGMTGVMVAVVPFDWQVHDTFFIVAHFHYVLIGGVVFPILGGIYFWWPKLTGRLPSETAGKAAFWLSFIGFNAAFFPMHIMGFLGMPRRVYTFPRGHDLEWYNLASTIGAFILALGVLVLVADLLLSLRLGRRAPGDPWGADSLEWSIPSPPPIYGFFRPPVVRGLHALWSPPGAEPPWASRPADALAGEPAAWRATLITDAVHARPQAIGHLPGPTSIPLFCAAGLLLGAIGVLFSNYAVASFGGIIAIGALVRWLVPKESLLAMLRQSDIGERAGLPIFTTGSRAAGWWGMVNLIACSATALAVLIYSYFFTRVFSDRWPQDGLPAPELGPAAAALAALLLSGGTNRLAARAFRHGEPGRTVAALGAGIALGALYLGLLGHGLSRLGFGPSANAYASLVFIITAVVMLYAATGIAINIAAISRVHREHADITGFAGLQMQITTMWWRFVVAAGLAAFATISLSPRLL